MSSTRRLPSISDNFSTLDLVNIYVDLLNKGKTQREDINVGEIQGGSKCIPCWRKLECGNTLLIWIQGTRFNKVSDVAISIYSSTKKLGDSGYEAHKGYLYAARQIIEQITDFDKFNEVIFFGHSLGAATALIASIIMQEEKGNRRVKGLGFAPPRCVCEQLSKITAGYCLAIVGRDDIVPSLGLCKVLGFINSQLIMHFKDTEKIREKLKKIPKVRGLRVPNMLIYLDEDKKNKEVDVRLMTEYEKDQHYGKAELVLKVHVASYYQKMVKQIEESQSESIKGSIKDLCSIYELKRHDLIEETSSPKMRSAYSAERTFQAKKRRKNSMIAMLAAQFQEGKNNNSSGGWRKIEVAEIHRSPELQKTYDELSKFLDQKNMERLNNNGISINIGILSKMRQKIEETGNEEEKQHLLSEFDETIENIQNLNEEIKKDEHVFEDIISKPQPRFEEPKEQVKPYSGRLIKSLKWLIAAGICAVLAPVAAAVGVAVGAAGLAGACAAGVATGFFAGGVTTGAALGGAAVGCVKKSSSVRYNQ